MLSDLLKTNLNIIKTRFLRKAYSAARLILVNIWLTNAQYSTSSVPVATLPVSEKPAASQVLVPPIFLVRPGPGRTTA
jgi:hypothetical protein